MTKAECGRWVEVSPSQFTHESEGLDLVRALMPDESPFRAWSNFEFRDSRGRWHEVDLLLLGRGRLHLVELKYYSGTLRGDDHNWLRDGKRPEESPLKLARRKAQYFASKLKTELRVWAAEHRVAVPDERAVIPFVQESVFLHHPRLRCLLSSSSAINLYGLVGAEATSGLPPISDLVLEPEGRRAIGPNQEQILVNLMERIGLVQRREREAGSWIIEDQAIDSDDGWQDWLASHRVSHQERARIRFQVTQPSAGEQARKDVRRLAEHEYRTMSRLEHDGLLRPRDLVESELGVGLVYPYDPQWQRLDLWLAGERNGVPLSTQFSMVRQIGEAVQYAHSNKVVHRGLSPKAVWVRPTMGTSDAKVRIGDWQTAGSVSAVASSRSGAQGVTSVLRGDGEPLAVDRTSQDAIQDPQAWLTEPFEAPEGRWTADADRLRLDVFGVGALAFYLLTGQPPARSARALKSRLREQNGLDVAIELPQVSSSLRSMVLKATHPSPTQRTADVATVLAQLAAVERESTSDSLVEDPLGATPGADLGGRFRLEQRLGQGSTAVGLLVTDRWAPAHDAERVLKVALDDAVAPRLQAEADVLRQFSSPRIVKVLEGPVDVGGRATLVLESAGSQTLTEVLRARRRLSLDLLERFGTDLLDALVVLDKAGVDHRDIKPSNLGVREGRGDRTKHLVLFDFSLTRAAASATSAGTPPYLDPFLTGVRDRYDSAAERYAAAVVLFEMATGATPTYGDGEADPAVIEDEAAVEPSMFDPALAELLVAFFRKALARDASRRHHTAEAMRTAWRTIFAGDVTTEPDESNDELASRAELTTALRDSGLTARALSALEPLGVSTVGELLTVDPVRLSRLAGVANSTRLQVSARNKQWRQRLGGSRRPVRPEGQLPAPQEAADLLIGSVANRRSQSRAALARLLLGIGTELDAFATNAQLAAHLPQPVSQARISQLLGTLQEVWAADSGAVALLDELARVVGDRLTDLGEVATPAELTAAVLAVLPSEGAREDRIGRGLLRLALERRKALDRADDATKGLYPRRRGGEVILLAKDQALLDLAESLGNEADRLVAAQVDSTRAVVPARRVQPRLAALLPAVTTDDQSQGGQLSPELADPNRLVRLAAAMSTTAAVSGAGELHHRDLAQSAALGLTFRGFGGDQQLGPAELRDRVRVRFPAVGTLPVRPALDLLVQEAGLTLVFDDRLGTYRTPEVGRTTGLAPRLATVTSTATAPVSDAGVIGVRLDGSVASRSFLALGVGAERICRFRDLLAARYQVRVVDVTDVLLESLRRKAAETGLSWDLVRAADAQDERSRSRRGLNELVKRSWRDVEAAVDEALAADGPAAPVLMVEAAPLARYENMGLLARWTDLAAHRQRALWLLVPQLGANRGPLLDGRPVPLSAPNQFVALDHDWIDTAASVSVTADKEL